MIHNSVMDLDAPFSYNYDEVYEDVPQIYNGSESRPLFTSHHSMPTTTEKTIRPDLEKLGLPVNILNAADIVYQSMTVGTKRGRKRKMLLFFCSFRAYNQENVAIDPIYLAEICGIESSDISKALSMCSPVYETTNTLIWHTPKHFIPFYFNKLNNELLSFPESAMDEIDEITKEVMEKDPDLEDEKPQTVAAAILVFYLQTKGYGIEKSRYKHIFGRSDMTINKIKKRVIKAYNE